MAKSKDRREIEIKLRVPDVDALRTVLSRRRGREITPCTYEFNTLYDTPRGDLRRHGRLIRIRIEQPATSFGKPRSDGPSPAILTYKQPSPKSTRKDGRESKRPRPRPFKIKEEFELSVSSAEDLAKILGGLGMHPVFRYEKFRTTFVLPGIRDLKIELDETPVGIYLELEGTTSGIDRAARLLGYTRQDYITDSYGALHLAACRRRGIRPGDMLFPTIKKLRSLALFS